MEKYASMWRADSPAERQDEATDLWNDLTGVDRKSNTRERLQSLFPASHSKEAAREQVNIYTAGQPEDVLGLPTGSIFNKAFSQEEVDKAKAALIANRRIAESDPTLGERAITGGIGALTGAGVGMLTKGFLEPRYHNRHLAMQAGSLGALGATALPHVQRRGIFGMGGMRGGLNLREKMLDERQAQLNKEAKMTAKQLRDMTIGGAAGLGALGLGIHQVNQSSRNRKGYTPREVRYAGEKAKALRMMELGGAPEGQIARHIRRANRKKDKMLDQLGPAGAGLVGAGVGGLSAGLGAKYLLDAVKAGV